MLKSELLSLACLWLFSVSFIHFGSGHAAAAWTAEIAWHHVSIPLALIVLLQDYRFLLLDVFFRFLLNFGLAAVYALIAFIINRRFYLWNAIAGNEFYLGIGIVIFCLALISFAVARSWLQCWLTLRLFRCNNINSCMQRLALAATKSQSEQKLLQHCAAALASCVSTQSFYFSSVGSQAKH